MRRYFVKTPSLLKRLFPRYCWNASADDRAVYLTFDDGPHPEITPWVLNLLAEYGAKATFFCIGKNVVAYPDVFSRITTEGHAVGNHTYSHVNGWQTAPAAYLANVAEAAAVIDSPIFRPPYGRIRKAQAAGIPKALGRADGRVIMWDVLSADFDRGISPRQCIRNVLQHTVPGSIVVFHDSEKAWPNLKVALPEILRTFQDLGYRIKAL